MYMALEYFVEVNSENGVFIVFDIIMVIMATSQHNATNLSLQILYRGQWIDLISTLELLAIF